MGVNCLLIHRGYDPVQRLNELITQQPEANSSEPLLNSTDCTRLACNLPVGGTTIRSARIVAAFSVRSYAQEHPVIFCDRFSPWTTFESILLPVNFSLRMRSSHQRNRRDPYPPPFVP